MRAYFWTCGINIHIASTIVSSTNYNSTWLHTRKQFSSSLPGTNLVPSVVVPLTSSLVSSKTMQLEWSRNLANYSSLIILPFHFFQHSLHTLQFLGIKNAHGRTVIIAKLAILDKSDWDNCNPFSTPRKKTLYFGRSATCVLKFLSISFFFFLVGFLGVEPW